MATSGDRWFRIVAPRFVAGLLVREGRVVEAAPILAWSVGREWPWVRAYFIRKGWHGERL